MDTNISVLGVIILVWIALAFFVAEAGKNKRIGFSSAFWISLLFSPILGLLIILISPEVEGGGKSGNGSSNSINGDRYKVSLDEAKKAAYKGEIEKSIGLYQDTLYYLDNDYKNINKKADQGRQSLMNDIRERIEELKNGKL